MVRTRELPPRRRWQTARSWLVFGLVGLIPILVVLLGTTPAGADAKDRRRGTVRLEGPSGRSGPIELTADGAKPGEGYSGDLAIVNDGKEPLIVSRIAVRGDAADPRSPAKLSARLGEGSLPITIPPGQTRRAIVQWRPERPARQKQLFGHIIVTTSDEASGEVAMGVRARIPGVLGPIDAHLLSAILGVPLLGAILTFVLHALGKRDEPRRGGRPEAAPAEGRVENQRDDRTPRAVTSIALGIQTLLAAWLYRGFVPDFSRADGNDGLQFVEHVVWVRGLSLELFLGADGIAATTLFATSVVAFLASLSERTVPRATTGYHAALLVLDAAVVGALTAMDGLLFLVFGLLVLVSATLLVGAWGGVSRRAAAMRIALPGGLALLLLAVAIVAVARQADPTFLVDGTKVTTTFSLPELSRVALGLKGATLLGGSLVKVGFVFVFAAVLFLLAAFPAHGWLGDVLFEAPPATGILVASAFPALGICAFLRVGCAVLPEGMRWASGVVVALGAVTAAYGALSVLGQSDLRRMAAAATTSQAGFVLLGAGSLTPQGLSGAIVLGSTRALACGTFLLLAAAIHERARTSETTRLTGVASQMPGWGSALAAAGLAQAGVLGLGGAWGPMLSLLGVLSGYAPLAIVAAIGLIVIAVAHLATVSRVAFAQLDPAWEKSDLLEPFGGRFNDLTGREWASIAPLIALVLLFGLWPAPLVGATTGTVRDLANAVSPPGPDQVAMR